MKSWPEFTRELRELIVIRAALDLMQQTEIVSVGDVEKSIRNILHLSIPTGMVMETIFLMVEYEILELVTNDSFSLNKDYEHIGSEYLTIAGGNVNVMLTKLRSFTK